jgi:hypothetical protein
LISVNVGSRAFAAATSAVAAASSCAFVFGSGSVRG